jgi:carbamoyltransferase
MEFGPRALGARSILADPRSPTMQSELNLRTKFREGFRPFAPSVLRERASEWFELGPEEELPYMLVVAPVRAERRVAVRDEETRGLQGLERLRVPRSEIPAVTHVDWSARVQTVSADTNPGFHAVLAAFETLTGCPVLVNTSFNVRGEPIVCTPADAYRCFMRTNIDYLVLGPFLLAKAAQPAAAAASVAATPEPVLVLD